MTPMLATAGLAIDGGTPVRVNPMPPWPVVSEAQIAAAEAVLRSGLVNYWTGDQGRMFETEFAEAHGAKHAVALANGTLALEAALLGLGIGPGDDVVVPARTFIATASAVVARGATPVVADIDFDSQNVNAETIRAALTPRTRAVIVVHLGGWPCDMDPIMALARERGLAVVEDCAQALGASYRGRAVGTIGDAGCFSFCQDKILTTAGEGGMLVTSRDEVWERAWSYKDHGKDFGKMREGGLAQGTSFRYVHDSFGSNWRMTEVQSAIGRVALTELPGWLALRRRNAAILDAGLADVPGLRLVHTGPDSEHAYYKYYAFVEPARLAPGWDRDRIASAVLAEGVGCFAGACPEIYREQAFAELAPADRLPVAAEVGETSLMLLVHPTLGPTEMGQTCAALRKIMARATRRE